MKNLFAICCIILGCALWMPPIVNMVSFDIQIKSYLKRAADANTVKMAGKELDKALKNIEARGLTGGFTHLLIKTPNGDLDFWYKNIYSARHETLNNLSENPTELELSNVLMKLRETLLDNTSSGTSVTFPPNSFFYPHQRIMWILMISGTILLIFGAIWFIAIFD